MAFLLVVQVGRRRFYVAVVAMLAVLAVLVVGFIGTALTRPVQMTFDSMPDNAETVSFSSESGSLLKGWIFDVPNARASAVLMHGVRSNRGELVSRAKWLNELGVSVLVFDFQSHGESLGDGITLGYLESMDAIAAVDVVKNRYPDIPRVALGISLGGASAMLASPSLDVDALVLESVYPDIETAIGNRIGARIPGGALLTPLLSWQIKPRAGVPASWLNPALRAQTIDVPALVLSGTEDTQTTVEDTHKLFNALAGIKQLHFFEGAAHVNLYRYDAQQYKQVVLAFLNTHLLYL